LQQVVWNLLSNAVKFTPAGGAVHVALVREGSTVEVRVVDTGKGIAPEFLPYVFDRFRQADSSISRAHGGLGIGLSIAKQLVELHGGRIEASSPGPGLGAKFVVRLPIAVPSASSSAASPRAAPPPAVFEAELPDLSSVRVLAIDDEDDARDTIRRILESSGALVASAATAAEGLRVLGSAGFDVVICDIGMPGEDGHAFIRQARSAGFSMPAIALTAYARDEDRAHALRVGYQMHLAKPVEPVELAVVVRALARPFGGSQP
jgi:CheY-like chemotaxis protein